MEMNEVERYSRFLLRSQTGRGWEQGYVFQGRRAQRGFGLGGFLKGVMKTLLPAAKTFAKTAAKKAAKSGINIASDLLSGRNIEDSFRSRGGEFARDMLSEAEAGLGVKRARRRKTESKPPLKRKRRRIDIWKNQEPWNSRNTRMKY